MFRLIDKKIDWLPDKWLDIKIDLQESPGCEKKIRKKVCLEKLEKKKI